MAAPPRYPAAVRIARLAAVKAALGTNSIWTCYAGADPGPDNALSGNTTLWVATVSGAAFLDPTNVGGVVSMVIAAPLQSAVAVATGTMGFIRAVTSGGVLVISGSCGTDGSKVFNFASLTATAGKVYTSNSLSIVEGNG